MDKNISYREVSEIIAVVSVVFSLIFVGLQLKQSTIASKAAAYQELGIATSEIWFKMSSDPALNDILFEIDKDPVNGYKNLSQSDKNRAISFVMGSLRLYETVYLQVEQGLLDSGALNYLGWEGFGRSNLLKGTWPDAKYFVTPKFSEYIESAYELHN